MDYYFIHNTNCGELNIFVNNRIVATISEVFKEDLDYLDNLTKETLLNLGYKFTRKGVEKNV